VILLTGVGQELRWIHREGHRAVGSPFGMVKKKERRSIGYCDQGQTWWKARPCVEIVGALASHFPLTGQRNGTRENVVIGDLS
jgi:hypothetical protein